MRERYRKVRRQIVRRCVNCNERLTVEQVFQRNGFCPYCGAKRLTGNICDYNRSDETIPPTRWQRLADWIRQPRKEKQP